MNYTNETRVHRVHHQAQLQSMKEWISMRCQENEARNQLGKELLALKQCTSIRINKTQTIISNMDYQVTMTTIEKHKIIYKKKVLIYKHSFQVCLTVEFVSDCDSSSSKAYLHVIHCWFIVPLNVSFITSAINHVVNEFSMFELAFYCHFVCQNI